MLKRISACYLNFLLTLISANSAALAESTVSFYDITQVAADDTLSLRAQAGSRNPLLAKIPDDARFLMATGREQKLGKSTWLELNYGQHTGWVNKHYLTPSATKEFTTLTCLGTEPFWSLDVESVKITTRDIDENETTYALSSVSPSNNHTNRWMLQGTAQSANELNIALWKTNSCSDDMSERSYQYEIIYNTPDDGVFSGCCNVIE